MGLELLFRSDRVVLPSGVKAAAVRVREGRILSIEPVGAAAGVAEIIDAEGAMILPGLVDTHVHINEPGRTEWEGFESATRAAAAGGVTTLLDMPLNSIPATTDVAAFRQKLDSARGKCHVDVGFIGGIVPGNAAELAPLHGAGVLAWKCFLVDSGVSEFRPVDEPALREALRLLSNLDGPLMVHAEHPQSIARARRNGMLRSHAEYLGTRPDEAERSAVELMLRLAEEFKVHVHIVHLSSGESVAPLVVARERGTPATVETCPHYLTFASEAVPDGATEYKCAPPIRSAVNRESLWEALEEGVIDCVVSDHSPSPPELKRRDEGDFAAAWGGIASLQLGLSAIWRGARARGLGMGRVCDWMATRPASVVRLSSKGRIAPGCDADLVLWDPEAQWRVRGDQLFHRHPLTPYEGMQLPGRVLRTYLRGRLTYAEGKFPGDPDGRVLLRESPEVTGRGTSRHT
jgi:allantoinase